MRLNSGDNKICFLQLYIQSCCVFSSAAFICLRSTNHHYLLDFISDQSGSKASLTQSVLYLSLCLSASGENDWDFQFCGTWRHGGGSRSLQVNLSPGCNGISVSASQSSLSISGEITAKCRRSSVINLSAKADLGPAESHFCLYWEPFYDQMKFQVKDRGFLRLRKWNDACVKLGRGFHVWCGSFVLFMLQYGGKNLTLCWPASLQGSCCTDLSHGSNGPNGTYGIVNGMVKTDLITHTTLLAYHFRGSPTECSKEKAC